jgi:subtilase family serine protease
MEILNMNRSNIKVLTVVFLVCIIVTSSYTSFVAAKTPELEAQPLHRVKVGGLNPDLLGDDLLYFNPPEIKAAYNLPTGDVGSGTIAIIDAYDNPNAANDLTVFSSQFGLKAPNLEIHKMSSRIQANSGWAIEISLDIQWAHAIAPNAKILLVEATTNSITNLLAAVDYARGRSDVVAISMSWGSNEFSGQTTYNSYFQSNYGATFFASSGDAGGVISWPSSSANVVSVGGTTLTNGASGYTETAWSGSGGGVSVYETKPTYQNSLSYSKRATPDVAYNADPNTGFIVYNTYGTQKGWFAVGGTSAGAPQWAAIRAITNSATNDNFYAGYPQSYKIDFTDIIVGQSGSYSASPNYDLSTGIGSPIGVDFAAPTSPDFAVSASPSSLAINVGTSKTASIAVSAIGGFTEPVTLSTLSSWVTLPAGAITIPYAPAELTITVPSGTDVGSTAIIIKGTSTSGTERSTTITVTVTNPDFSLTANPTSLNIMQGGSGIATVTVTSINEFVGSVELSTTAPNGWTTTITPNSINPKPTGSAQLTINVPQNTPSGPYSVTVQGTDGKTPKTVTLAVNVINPDFGLSASPTSLSIRQGRTGTSRITVTPINNYPASVTLTQTGTPAGMTVSFSKNPVSAGSYATMTVNVARNTPTGIYTLTITGTDTTGITHIITVKVTVTR